MFLNQSNIDQIDFWKGSVILIDKPYGFSSFKLVYEVRKTICAGRNSKLKIGHAGTLDPLATGLLILCTGSMTKQIDQFQGMVKLYSGKMILGSTRPTFDMESEIDGNYETAHISKEMMEEARSSFLGEQMMIPPIHSAVKVNGQRAYQLARDGKEVSLTPRLIVIHQYDIDTLNFPEIQFLVSCSKGTYIRSLVSEFGKRLQSGAYLSSLKREAIGDYKLQDAWSLEHFKECIKVA